MNITFLVNHDLPSLLALNYLIPNLAQHDLNVFYSKKNLSQTGSPLAELTTFDLNSLSSPSPLSGFEQFGAQPLNHINTLDFQRFRRGEPDIVISIRHMSILKPDVIHVPRLGVINLHSGLLPAYQGVMATFWALLNKEQRIGTTLHFIEDSTIDTGAIISQSLVDANYGESYLWNVLHIYKAGCANVLSAIEVIQAGNALISVPQSGDANYYGFPQSSDIARSDVPLFNSHDKASSFL